MDSIDIKDLLRLKKQLLPNGRAFTCSSGSDFEKLFLGISDGQKRMIDDSLKLVDTIYPDNLNFDESDCEKWEKIYGIIINTTDSIEVRKTRILQRIAYPNNQYARQHKLFIEKQLRDAGFDVYVYEFFDVIDFFTPSQYGDSAVEYGDLNIEYGGYTVVNYESIISDFIDKSREESIGFSFESLKNCFWIASNTFPNFANVSASQEGLLRQLILKLKPIGKIGFLLVNYT